MARPATLAVAFLLTLPTWAVSEDHAEEFFREKVVPILVGRCLECHGSEKKGGLDLRSRESAREGGESGAVIVPGKPGDSLLYQHVQSGEMPPKRPLAKPELAAIEQWIADGAWLPVTPLDPLAVTTDHRAGEDWWSLQPIRKPDVPQVRATDRVLTPIDPFVLAKLEESGLTLAPPADRATFLRRVTLDLVGMLPSFDEIRQFTDDSRPDAFERVVDRLLASEHYGERWGRHWLDVVRFAESNGFERDRIRTNFWPYRDYVIRAFNRDLPYDQFVIEQLAGDTLDGADADRLVATGYLVAGAKNDVGTVSEIEQKITRQDELDDFVATTGTTFLGLTVGCARCHDHKFDPIRITDYYSLTAVFSGLDRGDRPMASPAEVVRYNERVAAAKQAIQQTETAIERRLAPTLARLSEERAKSISAATQLAAPTVERNDEPIVAQNVRFVRFVVLETLGRSQPCLDELEIYGDDPTKNLALAAGGAKATASSLLPGYVEHQIHHLNDGQVGNAHSWISSEPVGWAQIELAEAAGVKRVVWGRDRQGGYRDRLPIRYRIDVSQDGQTWTKVSDDTCRAPYGTGDPLKIARPAVVAALPPADRAAYDMLEQEKARYEQELKSIAALPTSYGAIDSPPRPAFVLERGNVRKLGQPVKPAALSAIKCLDPRLEPTSDSGPARRRMLADWIVNPRNPLTSRVLVNRIWHYHFGQGIVNTPNDFGFNGDRPSHPELLDSLAADFMEHGWSVKRLHRMIVLSAAYRQSVQYREDAAMKDGANRLLWRMSPRRLAAEELRDAVLQVSGKLKLDVGGPSVAAFEYRDGNVPDYVLLDRPGPQTFRRTVYMYNIRTFQSPLLAAFDCPDVSVQNPKRSQTVSALQALSLLNNQFVLEQAQHFAERIAAADSAEPIALAYRLALLREPTDGQRLLAKQFIGEHGLAAFCRVLLNTNEFLYVY